jgi:uncharacterized membrane protein YeaQ/YmgE (transglycosylase-associated protein family)
MLIIGLIVGGLAKLIMPGRDSGGIFVTMMLGVAGAMVSGWIGRLLGASAGTAEENLLPSADNG